MTDQHIFSVSELNRDVRTLLETGFPLIWLQGEISNFSRPSSGHWYFTLKDAGAQVRCAMFKMRNRNVGFTPENGNQVLVRAKVGLYEPRGDYQLIIEHLEEAGDGLLQRAFDALKNRLQSEGLFDAQHKKNLPSWPKCIGVITSPTGAAVRDILTTLKRRAPGIPVIIYPVPVQGETAAQLIAKTIVLADRRKDCDVLILARGGGSLEDLWSFNEEIVARAIHHCELPLVVGVGHEIDFTIADFVADQRAPTPTAAAEMISPDIEAMQSHLTRLQNQLTNSLTSNLNRLTERLNWQSQRLQHPSKQLSTRVQRVDELEIRLKRAQQALTQRYRFNFSQLENRLQRQSPVVKLQQFQTNNRHLQERLVRAERSIYQQKQQQLSSVARALDAISPLATLSRGYAIVQKSGSNEVVRSSQDVELGEKISAKLGRGQITCTVIETEHD